MKLLNFLKLIGSDNRVEPVGILFWIGIIRSAFAFDIYSLALIAISLAGILYQDFRESTGNDQLNNRIAELESKVTQLSLQRLRGGAYGA